MDEAQPISAMPDAVPARPDPRGTDQPDHQAETYAQRAANRYLGQFDTWLVGLIGAALAAAAVYGASAGTCPIVAAAAGIQRPISPATAPSGVPKGVASAEPPAIPKQTANVALATPKGRGTADTTPPPAGTSGDNTQDAVTNAAESNAAGQNNSASAATTAVAVERKSATREQTKESAGSQPFTCGADAAFVSGLMGALLALFVAAAALAAGAFIGFLFGLPRTLTGERPTGRAAAPAQAGGGEEPPVADSGDTGSGQFGSDVNTNLERVSNWLTTIIVGVGLTKIEEMDDALGRLGDFVDGYFGYGGKPFAIAATLLFFVAGFFLIYVSTRVKLSMVFLRSQVDNFRSAKAATALSVVREAANASVTSPVTSADEVLLGKSLGDLKSDQEIIGWANAKARAGDPQSALTAYKDVLKRVPLTEKLSKDLAVILAATGDPAGADNVLGTLNATANLSAPVTSQLRQQVTAASLQNRLREGLYRFAQKGYEESIEAGEALLTLDDQASVGMNHVWLACAYGQKHWAIKASSLDVDEKARQLTDAKDKVVEHVEKAVSLDPTLKDLIRSLYDPGRQLGSDNDLQSLHPNERIDELLR